MDGAIIKIRMELITTFNQVLDVFAIREDVLYYKPSNDGWSIYQVLEHIMLANHFLLRIVDKQAERALHLAGSFEQTHSPKAYSLDVHKLKRMELAGSYVWVPQQYTDPAGDMPLLQLKMALHDQITKCLGVLQNNRLIEAIIKTHEAAKTDALHYLYFLVQHMHRHLQQVQRVKLEFSQRQRQTVYTTATQMSNSICLN
jgi:hypothetical protein